MAKNNSGLICVVSEIIRNFATYNSRQKQRMREGEFTYGNSVISYATAMETSLSMFTPPFANILIVK